jgi:hypothetical protein
MNIQLGEFTPWPQDDEEDEEDEFEDEDFEDEDFEDDYVSPGDSDRAQSRWERGRVDRNGDAII